METSERGKGTADHILPFGFFFIFFSPLLKMTHLFRRGMKLSWAVVFIAVVAIVVSNYIHEINSDTVDQEKDICDGVPRQRVTEGQGHMCTPLEKNFVCK